MRLSRHLFAQTADPALARDGIDPFLRNLLQAVIESRQAAGDGGHSVGIQSQVHRLERAGFIAVGGDQRPHGRLHRIHHIAGAADLAFSYR